MTQESVPATVFRGGTSKGVYFRESDMPVDRADREAVLLKTFGSPDPMQLDGIGGSHSTTSKAMLVSAADDEDVDVEYLFGQVAIEKPVVDWGGNCGNLTFAIGPFALERGLVEADVTDGRVDLVLRNANTGTVVDQSIPVEDGLPRYQGEFTVYGVPGTGGRITSRFRSPGGSVTGRVFPTGSRTETLAVDGVGDVDASLVDVSSPCVFVRAAAVGLDATERPEEINADPALLDRLERVRSAACERYGFVDDRADATTESPGIPKLAVVGERRPYETVNGDTVTTDEYDLLARIMSMQKAHHAYAVTGAMCTAVAASLPGTIPSEYLDAERPEDVVIGHPKGTMRVGVGLGDGDGEGLGDGDDGDGDGRDEVLFTEVDRTARQIMVGDLYYRPE